MKGFADDNFESDENGRRFFKRVENYGKRRNCSLRAISPFPAVFSKDLYCRHVKTRACLGKGWICYELKGWICYVTWICYELKMTDIPQTNINDKFQPTFKIEIFYIMSGHQEKLHRTGHCRSRIRQQVFLPTLILICIVSHHSQESILSFVLQIFFIQI